MLKKSLALLSILSWLPLLALAQQQPQADKAPSAPATPAAEQPKQVAKPMTVEEELKPHPELGDRPLSVLSPEAQKILRERLMKESNRVLPPVPREVKKTMYDNMVAASPMSMRDMFNFMAAKRKVKKGVKFDDVIEAMDLKANDVNFKKVGHNKFWKDVSAVTGLPAARVEILQYCDAMVGRRILDYSPEFVIFIPCRIAVYEDANGDIWLMTMDWDVSWLAKAWHPDTKLPEELKKDAARIRDAMDGIMKAGAEGGW